MDAGEATGAIHPASPEACQDRGSGYAGQRAWQGTMADTDLEATVASESLRLSDGDDDGIESVGLSAEVRSTAGASVASSLSRSSLVSERPGAMGAVRSSGSSRKSGMRHKRRRKRHARTAQAGQPVDPASASASAASLAESQAIPPSEAAPAVVHAQQADAQGFGYGVGHVDGALRAATQKPPLQPARRPLPAPTNHDGDASTHGMISGEGAGEFQGPLPLFVPGLGVPRPVPQMIKLRRTSAAAPAVVEDAADAVGEDAKGLLQKSAGGDGGLSMSDDDSEDDGDSDVESACDLAVETDASVALPEGRSDVDEDVPLGASVDARGSKVLQRGSNKKKKVQEDDIRRSVRRVPVPSEVQRVMEQMIEYLEVEGMDWSWADQYSSAADEGNNAEANATLLAKERPLSSGYAPSETTSEESAVAKRRRASSAHRALQCATSSRPWTPVRATKSTARQAEVQPYSSEPESGASGDEGTATSERKRPEDPFDDDPYFRMRLKELREYEAQVPVRPTCMCYRCHGTSDKGTKILLAKAAKERDEQRRSALLHGKPTSLTYAGKPLNGLGGRHSALRRDQRCRREKDDEAASAGARAKRVERAHALSRQRRLVLEQHRYEQNDGSRFLTKYADDSEWPPDRGPQMYAAAAGHRLGMQRTRSNGTLFSSTDFGGPDLRGLSKVVTVSSFVDPNDGDTPLAFIGLPPPALRPATAVELGAASRSRSLPATAGSRQRRRRPSISRGGKSRAASMNSDATGDIGDNTSHQVHHEEPRSGMTSPIISPSERPQTAVEAEMLLWGSETSTTQDTTYGHVLPRRRAVQRETAAEDAADAVAAIAAATAVTLSRNSGNDDGELRAKTPGRAADGVSENVASKRVDRDTRVRETWPVKRSSQRGSRSIVSAGESRGHAQSTLAEHVSLPRVSSSSGQASASGDSSDESELPPPGACAPGMAGSEEALWRATGGAYEARRSIEDQLDAEHRALQHTRTTVALLTSNFRQEAARSTPPPELEPVAAFKPVPADRSALIEAAAPRALLRAHNSMPSLTPNGSRNKHGYLKGEGNLARAGQPPRRTRKRSMRKRLKEDRSGRANQRVGVVAMTFEEGLGANGVTHAVPGAVLHARQ